MADLSAITPQNWIQYQMAIPQLRGGTLEGFAQGYHEAVTGQGSTNPEYFNRLIAQIQQADLNAGFVQRDPGRTGSGVESDALWLARQGLVAPGGEGGLYDQSDFSQFITNWGETTSTDLDSLFKQKRYFQELPAGVNVGGAMRNQMSQWYSEVTRSGVDPRSVTMPDTYGGALTGDFEGARDAFAQWAEDIGLAKGESRVDPFQFGVGPNQAGTIQPRGAPTPTSMPTPISRFDTDPVNDQAGTGAPGEGIFGFGREQGVVGGAPSRPPSVFGGGGIPNVSGGGLSTGGGSRIGGGAPYVPKQYDFDFNFTVPTAGIPSVGGTLDDLYQGRRALASQSIQDLQRFGPSGVNQLRGAVPELDRAAQAAEGAFGQDLGDTFGSALQQAAEVRGVNVGDIPDFDAELASESFQDQSIPLATRTGFENLMFSGFVPPQNLNFQTLGSLSMQQANLQAEVQAGVNQSLQAQSMFSMMLPGLLDANDPLTF